MKQKLERTYCSIESHKIKDPVRIVQISDLHDREYGRNQSDLVDAVLSEHPDFAAVTGDLFNRRKPAACSHALMLIRKLSANLPCFIVAGNHEARLGETGERYLQKVKEEGGHLLRNESCLFQGIHIIGLRQRPSAEDLKELIDPARFNLVLSHRPELMHLYASCHADLVLAGHAHGGQIRFFGQGLIAPQQGLFPKYTAGLYEQNGTKMFVSKGLGDTVPVPRINNPHEINVIEILPGS